MSFTDEEEDVIGGGFPPVDDDLLADDLGIEDPEKLPVDEEDDYDPESRFH